MKRALITGISGQIGQYLKAFLEERDYHVDGTMRIPGCAPELELLERNTYDEVYVLHQVRHQPPLSWTAQYEQGVLNGIKILEAAQTAKVVFAGTILLDDELAVPTPWLQDRRALAGVVASYRPEGRSQSYFMPHLWQYVSVLGSPRRQYLMQVLHEIAGGVTPNPLAPNAPVVVGHAKDAARFLHALLNAPTAYQTARFRGDIRGFIQEAQNPDSWLGEIVREIQDKKTQELLSAEVHY